MAVSSEYSLGGFSYLEDGCAACLAGPAWVKNEQKIKLKRIVYDGVTTRAWD